MRRLLPLLVLLLALPSRAGWADAVDDQAGRYARDGMSLVAAGNWEAALVAFQMAFERVPSPDYVLNMATCEFQLGQVKNALGHYQQYLDLPKDAPASKESREKIEFARMRIEAIKRRPSVVMINSIPPGAAVRIEGDNPVAGTAPNEFRLPAGRYRITAALANYTSQTRELDIAIATNEFLLFTLEPVPARLEIHTIPRDATLYVRGNRARNPYQQQVAPGTYEIYAEATNYRPRSETVALSAGQRLSLDFDLPYVQRSGRPELLAFYTGAGALAGVTAVVAGLEVTSTAGTLAAAAGLTGGLVGTLLSTSLVPPYIRDNVALFRIGIMSIGALEGATIALNSSRRLFTGWVGGVLGLGAGGAASLFMDRWAPKYGRVAMLQSGAVLGALAGALAVKSFKTDNAGLPLGIFGGLNVGLAAGLGLAYWPDPQNARPSWQRVTLVDLAAAAGAFMGAVGTTVAQCLADDTTRCSFADDERPTARFALAGGMAGLAFGWLLTKNFDRDAPVERPSVSLIPMPTAVAVSRPDGSTSIVPGLAAQGRF